MRITVLLPAYNAERHISEAIESVLAQTYKNFDLFIIDDGSSDSTLKIAQHYSTLDSRVRVITQPNMGMGATLNKVLKLVDSEWIVRMDNDDIMVPQRLERQIEFLRENPDVDVTSSFVYIIDSTNRVIGKGKSLFTDWEIVKQFLRRNELIGIHHPGVMARTSVLNEIGGYRPQFWPAEDIDLWIRLVEKGYKLLVQPEYLLRYRVHGASMSVKDAYIARRKVNWVKACMLARRADKQEPSWEEFVAEQKKLPAPLRLNQERKDFAKVFYKAAVLSYSERKYLRLFVQVFLSTVLQPSYAIMQILRKYE